MESIGRLAGGVAHDFNNMLSAILGHAELAMMQVISSEPVLDHLKAIKKASLRSADLVRQLLAFARKQTVSPKVLDLNDTVAGMYKMLKRLIGEDIEFRATLDPAAGSIKADPGQIEQVIMNLAVNARDAMPNGGKITVTTTCLTLDETTGKALPGLQPGQYVMLAIADTGTGMTDEVKAHIFEPFFTTKPPGKGTGLGLATCFGIVQQSSGHIEVESKLGQGTTFKLYLPQVPDAVEPARAGNLVAPAPGGTETVLLVEDEAIVRELAVATLREVGYSVIEAGNGEEALRLARQHNGEIGLVLTDVVMPVMGGKELAETLRAAHPDTKVLFTSGYSEEVIGDQGVLRPGIAFLQKPYLAATLARRVREVLDQPLN
jgi:CheY-like chemotaxis protein